ncbi:MAG: hypothetical protein ACOX89_04305, partial [Lutispora sp.]
ANDKIFEPVTKEDQHVRGFFYKDSPIFKLSDLNLARALLVATHINYINVVMASKKTPMVPRDMIHIFGIGEKSVRNLVNSFRDIGFLIDSDVGLCVNQSFFIKGDIPDKLFGWAVNKKAVVIRIYNQSLMSLFKKNKNICRIGTLIRLLPWLHTKYNILCQNPFEERPEYIRPLTPLDCGQILGVYKDRIYKYLGELESFVFDSRYGEDYIIKRTEYELDGCRNNGIIVNPLLFNSICDIDTVLKLGNFRRIN